MICCEYKIFSIWIHRNRKKRFQKCGLWMVLKRMINETQLQTGEYYLSEKHKTIRIRPLCIGTHLSIYLFVCTAKLHLNWSFGWCHAMNVWCRMVQNHTEIIQKLYRRSAIFATIYIYIYTFILYISDVSKCSFKMLVHQFFLTKRRSATMTLHERNVVSNHRTCHCLLNSLRISTSNVRITGPLWREFTGHRWIPRTKGQ